MAEKMAIRGIETEWAKTMAQPRAAGTRPGDNSAHHFPRATIRSIVPETRGPITLLHGTAQYKFNVG